MINKKVRNRQQEWTRIKSNPTRLKRHRESSRIAQRKRYKDVIKKNNKRYQDHIKKIQIYTQISWFGKPRVEILNKWDNKCAVCSSTVRLCIHHINNKGRNTPKNERDNSSKNLIVLCHFCHSHIQGFAKIKSYQLANDLVDKFPCSPRQY